MVLPALAMVVLIAVVLIFCASGRCARSSGRLKVAWLLRPSVRATFGGTSDAVIHHPEDVLPIYGGGLTVLGSGAASGRLSDASRYAGRASSAGAGVDRHHGRGSWRSI